MPEQAAGNINIVLSVNKANYTAAMAEAQRQLDIFAGKATGAGKATASSMVAGSAAAKELTGHWETNTRGAIKFLTTIPGVGSALKAAFPLIGGIAFAGMLTGIATQIADFVKKANAMPEAIRNGFAALNLEQQTSIDSLNVMTDKLNEAHAAFEHKPGNGTKTAIDEAKESADKFAASVVAANAKVDELLTKNSSGLLSALFLAKPMTGEEESAFKEYQRVQNHNAYRLANAEPGSDEARAAQKAMQDTRAGFIADRERALPFQEAQGGAVAADAEGVLAALKNEAAQELAVQQNAAAQGQAAKDEAAKKAAQQAKETAAQQLEAQKKAMQDGLDALKADHEVNVGETLNYWDRQVAATTHGSELYKFALGKFGEANQEWYRWLDEEGRKLDEDAKKKAETIARWDEMAQRLSDELDAEAEHVAEAQGKLSEANAKNAAELNALTRAHQLATGAITTHDAAVQEAADHAAEYAAQLKALQDEKAGLSQKELDNGKDIEIDAQIANVKGAASRAATSDQWNIDNSTAGGAFKSALQEFIAASRDGAQQMRSIVTNTLGSLNEQIVNGMMGQRTNFKGVGQGLARNLASTTLSKAEGSIMSAFGLGGGGKLGTISNPMWVKMAETGKGIGSLASGVTGKLGGVFGGLLKAVLPGLATGGPIDGPAIVGENGPELFSPGVAGYITPNYKLNSASGGDIHFHPGAIDARGSTDPAQVEAAVQRGIRQAAPHLMAGSVQANREAQKRRPSRG